MNPHELIEIKKSISDNKKDTNPAYQFIINNNYIKCEGSVIPAEEIERLFDEPFLDEFGYENSKWRMKFQKLSDLMLSDGIYIASTRGNVRILSAQESFEHSNRKRMLNAMNEYKISYQLAAYPFKHLLQEEDRKRWDASQRSAARSSLMMQEEMMKNFNL